MAEKVKREGLASIIKYEGDNETLVWKHPIEDFNMGSQLIVHESQEAIFFRDGQALDLFGPGRYTLETQQLPILEKLYDLPTNPEGTFHSEVYFINKAVQMAIKWGTAGQGALHRPPHQRPAGDRGFRRAESAGARRPETAGQAGGHPEGHRLGGPGGLHQVGPGLLPAPYRQHGQDQPPRPSSRPSRSTLLEIDERVDEISAAAP